MMMLLCVAAFVTLLETDGGPPAHLNHQTILNRKISRQQKALAAVDGEVFDGVCYKYVCVCICIYTFLDIYLCMYVYMYIYVYVYAYIYTRIFRYINMYIYTYIHMYIHT